MSPAAGPAALVRHVERSIARARQGRSKLDAEPLMLEGLSAAGVRHLLNNLCDRPSVKYLEVGTYKGSTLVAASYDNAGRFTAVDDFSEFGHMGARAAFEQARRQFRGRCRFTLHEGDCWSPALRRRLPRAVNVYFYDGPHRYEDQYRAFTHFDALLAPTFVAVVDDWNSSIVRRATQQAFTELGYRVVHKRELFTRRRIRDHWWNGLLVAVVRKRAQRRVKSGSTRLRAAPAGGRRRKAGSAPGRSTPTGVPAPAGAARRRRALRRRRP